MVPLAEISDPKNDFNLNLPRYIDSTEPEDLQDIDGHLRGGIPDRDIDALDRYWQVFPGRALAAVRVGGPPRLQPPEAARRRAQGRHLRPCGVHRLQRLRHRPVREVEEGQRPAPERHRHRRQAQGADRNAVRRPAGNLRQERRCSTPTTSTST